MGYLLLSAVPARDSEVMQWGHEGARGSEVAVFPTASFMPKTKQASFPPASLNVEKPSCCTSLGVWSRYSCGYVKTLIP